VLINQVQFVNLHILAMDHMHLGWKGWVDIDEAIQQFYKAN
ncbi:D-alanyl-lipoteichoic acid biosynthesis protein DltD, partial [Bacillus sp. B-TM1]